jgi:hypothetical protein
MVGWNLDQAEVVVRAVARVPGEVGVDIREQAAATLVELCAEVDPEQLRHAGDRILFLVAPEVAEDLDRRAVERDEAQAHRERYFSMIPDGLGVRLSGRLTAEGAAIVRAAIDPRRLACEASIVPCVLDTHGVPLDLGRTHRLVSAPLRTALNMRDRGCAFPGCDRPARWTTGCVGNASTGRTSMAGPSHEVSVIASTVDGVNTS